MCRKVLAHIHMHGSLAQRVSGDHPLYLHERRWHQALFDLKSRISMYVFTYNDADNDSHDDVHVYNDDHEYADDSDSDLG